MTAKCTLCEAELTNQIVGDSVKALQSLIDRLGVHMKERHPAALQEIGMLVQGAVGTLLMDNAECEDPAWIELVEAGRRKLLEKLMGEDLETGEYDEGFEDARGQIVEFIRRRAREIGLPEDSELFKVAAEVEDMPIEEGDEEGAVLVQGEKERED